MSSIKYTCHLIDSFSALAGQSGVAPHEVFGAAVRLVGWMTESEDSSVRALMIEEMKDVAPDMLAQKHTQAFGYFVQALSDIASTEKNGFGKQATASLNSIAIRIEDHHPAEAQALKAQVKKVSAGRNILN